MNIASKKIRDAINSLILSHPLFAGILIQQKFVEDNSRANPTFSVNGTTFRYNSNFADTLSFDEIKAVCAHEASHLAGLHHARMGDRDPSLWNQATDYAINSLLVKSGFALPDGALISSEFDGQASEDIYRVLWNQAKISTNPRPGNPRPDDSDQSDDSGESGDSDQSDDNGQREPDDSGDSGNGQDSDDKGQGESSGKNPCGKFDKADGDAKTAEAKAKIQIEQAMGIARMAGAMSLDGEREIQAGLAPRYDWREILHRFFQEMTANDYSFAQPNKRFVHAGIILPSLRSRDVGRIVLAVDTSGSISTDEVSAMVAEMQNCMDCYCESGIGSALTVIYCDSEIRGIEELTTGDTPSPRGGGGTSFIPVFRHLAGDLDGAAALVYLTDGYGDSPNALETVTPSYPVLWGLITENPGFSPPFGEVFKFDIHA